MKMYQFFFTLLLATLGSLTSVLSAASVDDLVFGLINDNTEYAVTDCDTAASGDLTIPATYEGKPVTQIGNMAFFSASDLTSITIPDTVNDIGTQAFMLCRSLVSVNIPDAVTAIKPNTFFNCESLTSITIHSGITSIGSFAFYNCQALTEVKIPNSVTSLGSYAFSECFSLESITLSEALTKLEASTFFKCTSLKEIKIPETVTEIENNVFQECTSLTSVTIPDSVTVLSGEYVFLSCLSLESVTLPDSVTNIGDAFFQGCIALDRVYFRGAVPTFSPFAFEDASEDITLYVQEEHLADFQALNLDFPIISYTPKDLDAFSVSTRYTAEYNQFILVSRAEDSSWTTQVQYTDDIAGGIWTTLSNLAYIGATNAADDTITRTITNVDPSVNADRFYCLFSHP